nr:MAG TPA: hypothetical protein [Inoviridae sp.]
METVNQALKHPPTSNTGGLPKSEAFEHFVVVKDYGNGQSSLKTSPH